MEKIKKIELKYKDNSRTLEYFKINGKKYGLGIERAEIIINASQKPKILLFGNESIIKDAPNLKNNLDIKDNIFDIENTFYVGSEWE